MTALSPEILHITGRVSTLAATCGIPWPCSLIRRVICLTQKQVTAVNKIWSGVTDTSGNLVFPGLVKGGEAARGGWSTWVTGSEPFSYLHWLGGAMGWQGRYQPGQQLQL